MDILKRLKTHWVHFKILFFGDKEFKLLGHKYLPCYECDEIFLSHMHFHDNYDSVCRNCLKKMDD